MLEEFAYRPSLQAGEIYLRLLEEADAPALLKLYKNNRDFLQPWEPARDEDFYQLDTLAGALQLSFEKAQLDQMYSFGIFLAATNELIGRITLNNVVRGVFQNADAGYFLAQSHNRRGYTTRAVKLVLGFAFHDLSLHRVSAATLLHNYASMKVLQKAGFRKEGLARHYLKINGTWQDHNLFAITADEFTG